MKIKVEKATPEKLRALEVESWSPWECEPTEFDWEYSQDERAYVKEGRVVVHAKEGDVEIQGGDIVLFPKGLKCHWKVKETIRKVYRFE
ncbi:cupin domain-containing protein [candidate division FCPU426 bacterium]|nr:cupin domain-containing protein [candidate division FCPU426 bacterium]